MSGVCIGPGDAGSGGCAGVIAAAGRKFLAACKIHHILFFWFLNTRYTNDLVIMTQQNSLLGRGLVGVSLQGQRCVK